MANVELGPHQLEAIKQLSNGHILCGDVGTGKSRTALAYYYLNVCRGHIHINGGGSDGPMERPRDLYIITTAKKRDGLDWEEEAVKFCLSSEPDLNGVTLHVDSWNNIKKYTGVENAFFIFDEQRVVGYGAWVKAFLAIAQNNLWILLSATPGDTWLDYIPVFIANGFYRNKSQFLEQHAVWDRWSKFPKVKRFVGEAKLRRLRSELLVDMPYPRRTTRIRKVVPCTYDVEAYKRVWKDRWNIYEDHPVKEVGELFSCMRRVVNSDPSRLDAVIQLSYSHPRMIIFYNFDYELEALRERLEKEAIPYSEWNGHKHEEILTGAQWAYLVQYTAGAEGWNCVTTDTIIFYSLNYSYRMTAQAEGRIDRMNTPFTDLFYFSMRSNSPIDLAVQNALKRKKRFNERSYLQKSGITVEGKVLV